MTPEILDELLGRPLDWHVGHGECWLMAGEELLIALVEAPMDAVKAALLDPRFRDLVREKAGL